MNAASRLAAALHTVAQHCGNDDLGCICVFLCICEHNGVCFKDLARLCRLSEAKVSRTVEALRQSGTAGLVEVFRHPTDGRKRLVFLTEEGGRLRDAMEALVHDG